MDASGMQKCFLRNGWIGELPLIRPSVDGYLERAGPPRTRGNAIRSAIGAFGSRDPHPRDRGHYPGDEIRIRLDGKHLSSQSIASHRSM
jgi:hypothetical protein